MDCSPPGSSVHGDSPGKNTGVDCHALLQRIFQTQGLNPGLPHCRQILYHLSHKGSSRILDRVACPFSRRSSPGMTYTCRTGIHHQPGFTSVGEHSQACCISLKLSSILRDTMKRKKFILVVQIQLCCHLEVWDRRHQGDNWLNKCFLLDGKQSDCRTEVSAHQTLNFLTVSW